MQQEDTASPEDFCRPDTWHETDSSNAYTVSEAIEHIGFGRFQLLMLLYVGFAWMADAMEMMILSFLGPAMRCQWNLDATKESLITSVVFAGTMLGAYSWGWLSDAKGRRIGFFGTAMFTFLFGILSALAPNYQLLFAARFFVGVGLGGVPTSLALFMEFLPASDRARWLVALQSFWMLGTVAEAGLAWLVLYPLGWRWLLALSSLPLFLLALLFPLLPESPFFLAAAGKPAAAQLVLERVACTNAKSLPPGRLQEREGPAEPRQHKKQPPASAPLQLPILRPLGPPIAAFLQQLRGIYTRDLAAISGGFQFIWFVNALAYYGVILLTTSIHGGGASQGEPGCGLDGRLNISNQDFRAIFITTAAELPGLLIAAFGIDILGRRWFATAGVLITGCFILPLTLKPPVDTLFLFGARALETAAFACLYVWTPEAYPTAVRTFGLGVANMCARLGAAMAPFFAVYLVRHDLAPLAEVSLAMACFVAAAISFCITADIAECSDSVTVLARAASHPRTEECEISLLPLQQPEGTPPEAMLPNSHITGAQSSSDGTAQTSGINPPAYLQESQTSLTHPRQQG
ncbi:hypothetical protein WJX74_010182 [Apatococcus lobatus]|uniref:Major facilitator superfamily (MFS) profile domain-containing protein n=1 Tax=Apatococcus lobatus TaxID=904363 RepID=A0AAW1S834_9CHLO